jgi:hypothetical protein
MNSANERVLHIARSAVHTDSFGATIRNAAVVSCPTDALAMTRWDRLTEASGTESAAAAAAGIRWRTHGVAAAAVASSMPTSVTTWLRGNMEFGATAEFQKSISLSIERPSLEISKIHV